jgi:predicted aspartyl protease
MCRTYIGRRILLKRLSDEQTAFDRCRSELEHYRRGATFYHGQTASPTGYIEPASSGFGVPIQMTFGAQPVMTQPNGCVEMSVLPTLSSPTTAISTTAARPPRRGRGNGRRSNDVCHRYGIADHWARNCTMNRPDIGPSTAGANGGTGERKQAEVYLPITMDGKRYSCLVDTGCELSLIPRKLVPRASRHPTEQRVFAANGTEMPIFGLVRLRFDLDEIRTAATCLVSEAIEKMMLGIDWLTEHSCQWQFNNKTLVVDGCPLKLLARPSRIMSRCIYAEQDLTMPPNYEANIKALMTWSSLGTAKGDWLLEAFPLRPGVLIARTVVSDDQSGAAVHIVNVSGKNQRIKRGNCFGALERVDVCKMQPAIDTTERDTRRQITPPTTMSATGSVEPVQSNETTELSLLALPEDLTPEQRSQAENLIRRNVDIILKNDSDIGRTHLVQHRIDTGSHSRSVNLFVAIPLHIWTLLMHTLIKCFNRTSSNLQHLRGQVMLFKSERKMAR